jgi:hypothetical protein
MPVSVADGSLNTPSSTGASNTCNGSCRISTARVELDERLKSVLLPSAGSGTQNVERAGITRIRQHLDRMTHSREIEPPGLSL